MANAPNAPHADAAAVAVTGLAKSYRIPAGVRRQMRRATGEEPPAWTRAVEGLSLEVRPGEVYGVLGPNGAGKTTLMKVLATILIPDAGEVRVLGHDLVREAHRVRPRIGVVLGEYERTFHWRLTGRQSLRFFADFYGVPRHDVDERIEHVLHQVDLLPAADTRFNAYSTGMKHRLALARALLPDPRLLLLDEPTAGLDPDSSGRISEVVRERAAAGVAVIYTTHRLHEAGVLCDRILVLDRGRRVAEASPEELGRLAKGQQVVEARRPAGGAWEKAVVEAVAAVPGVTDWETRRDRLLLYTPNDDEVVAAVVAELRRRGAGTYSITVRPPDVEDAFLTLLQEARAKDPEASP